MRTRHLLLLLWILPAVAFGGSDLVKKPSKHDVKTTVDKLETLVKGKGMTVFARVDHRANAESIGMSMTDSQLLIFGAPKVGTLVMQGDPAAGVDLPMRVLAYTDAQGKTWVVYHNPQGLKNDFSLEGAKVIDKMEKALDNLTNGAIR